MCLLFCIFLAFSSALSRLKIALVTFSLQKFRYSSFKLLPFEFLDLLWRHKVNHWWPIIFHSLFFRLSRIFWTLFSRFFFSLLYCSLSNLFRFFLLVINLLTWSFFFDICPNAFLIRLFIVLAAFFWSILTCHAFNFRWILFFLLL